MSEPDRIAAIREIAELSQREAQRPGAVGERLFAASDVRYLLDRLAVIERELDGFKAADRELSDAYLRIRALVNAWDTAPGGSDRFEVTERRVSDLKARTEHAEAALLTLQRQVRLVIPGLVSEIRAAAKYREGMLSAQIEPLPEWADRLAALLPSLAEKDNTS